VGLLFAGLNPRFFHWPSLMFYAVAAIYRVGWEIGHLRGVYHLKFDMYKDALVNAAPFLLVPRAVSAACGVATIWFVYRFVDRLFDRLTALTAAFFVAVAYLHVRDSHFGVTDIPMTALAVAAMMPLGAALLDPSPRRNWVRGGVLCGLAASTKYNGGIVALVGVAVATIGMLGKGGGEPSRQRAAWRGLLAFLAATLVAFLCGTPFALLDAPHFFEGLQFDASHLMEGHGILLGRGWIYHLTFSLWYGLGGPLLLTALAGMLVIAARSWRRAVLVSTFPVLYYLVVGRGYTVFVRYVTPVVPFLSVTAAFLVVELIRRIARPAHVPALVACVATLVALPSLNRAVRFDALVAKQDTLVLADEWLKTRLQPSDWIQQAPVPLLYPEVGSPRPANQAAYDAGRHVFLSPAGTIVSPDWLVLMDSPLRVYTVMPEGLMTIASRDYTPVMTIAATRGPEMATWFDQQDRFFVPYTNFSVRERPGPEITIWRRKTPPAAPSGTSR
jgi:hypothetical protein